MSSARSSREQLIAVQTPQAFPVATLRERLRGRSRRCDRLRIARRGGRRTREVGRGRPAAAEGDHAGRSGAGRLVAVKAVVFDVGETLIDETGCGSVPPTPRALPRFTLMGVARRACRPRRAPPRVWEILGVEQPAVDLGRRRTSIPTRCRAWTRSRRAGCASVPSATRSRRRRSCCREHVDLVGSSARWGVEKPAPAFFERIVAECGVAAAEIAYVGDRVDNDVVPALAAGHGRRAHPPRPVGPPARAAAAAICASRSLAELPEVLGCLSSGSGWASTPTRSRTASRSSSAASRSTTRAASPGTPTAT